jgi:hypothetical protein
LFDRFTSAFNQLVIGESMQFHAGDGLQTIQWLQDRKKARTTDQQFALRTDAGLLGRPRKPASQVRRKLDYAALSS